MLILFFAFILRPLSVTYREYVIAHEAYTLKLARDFYDEDDSSIY